MGFIEEMLKEYFSNSMVLFAILLFISIAIFKFIEDPLNDYIRRRFRKAY
jgi:hypothetical protein